MNQFSLFSLVENHVSKFERIIVATVLVVVAFAASSGAHDVATPPSPPHPKDADHWAWHNLCNTAGDNCTPTLIERYGCSLIQYPRPLQRGDSVEPFRTTERSDPLRCEHICSLYFLDLRPGAHFAHPTVVGLYDWESGEFQAQPGEWWPVVNGGRHVFETVGKRVRFAIDGKAGLYGLPTMHRKNRPDLYSPDIVISPPDLSSGQSRLVAGSCKVHALVINGYKDPRDSFDEDTDGIYTVLRGLGVPDEQILFLSPIDTDWRDHPTSIDNIEAAINEIAAKANPVGECSEFVLFISSHGDENEINLMPRKRHHLFLRDSVLGGWLSAIKGCPKWTVVVEACKSESLADEIEKAADSADLRYLYSAAHDTESWGDIDENDLNPEDLGSETVWGYIEAFGASEADVAPAADPTHPKDRRLTFLEAIDYSEAKDASKVGGVWMAVANEGQNDAGPAHACSDFPDNLDVAVNSGDVTTKRTKKVAPYGETQVVRRCSNAPVWVTVKNQGVNVLPVGTLRLYGRTLKSDGTPSSEFASYANLVLMGGLEGGKERTFKLRWGVRPIFKKKQRVELMALLDSPQAPVWEASSTNLGPWTENQQACQCSVSVVKRCMPIVGCECRKYVNPEITLK